MATTEEILNQLLSLPVDTRAQVAQRLLESLEGADEKTREAWAAETERRLDAFDKGEMQALPGEEVLARLRGLFPRLSSESKPTEVQAETPEAIVSAMRNAMNDQLFLDDLWDTMKDFEHADRELETT